MAPTWRRGPSGVALAWRRLSGVVEAESLAARGRTGGGVGAGGARTGGGAGVGGAREDRRRWSRRREDRRRHTLGGGVEGE